MTAIISGVVLLVLAAAWLRYARRLELWTRSNFARRALRRSSSTFESRWYVFGHVWAGAAFLAVFGVLLVVEGLIGTR